MADTEPGRRLIVGAAVMILVAQVLAITNDLYLRLSDPSDLVLLVVLIALAALVLRRARWARWIMVVLVAAGGAFGLAGFVLLVGAATSPGLFPAVASAIPALAGLRADVLAFTSSSALPLLAASVLVSAVLDLVAAAMLAFAPSVRAYFARAAASASSSDSGSR